MAEEPGDVLARLQEHRIVMVGPLDGEAATDVVLQILRLAADDEHADISLYLNSPGGADTAGAVGMSLLDTMERVAPDVRTYGMGRVAGSAALVLAAGARGKRFVLPHTRVQLEAPASVDLAGPERTRFLAQQRAEIARLLAGFTGRPVDEVTADLTTGRWFLGAEAVAYGLADAVLARGA